MKACCVRSRTKARGCRFARVLISATLALLFATAASTGAAVAAETTDVHTGAPVDPRLDLTEDLTREEIRDLMSRLSDDQVRELLLQQLDRNAAELDAAERDDAIDEVYEEAQDLKAGMAAALRAVKTLPELPSLVWGAITEGGTLSLGALLLPIALIFGVAWSVEWLYRHMTKTIARHTRDTDIPSPFARLGLLILRAFIESIGVAAFALTAFGVSILVSPGGETSSVLYITLVTGVVVLRLVAVVARFIFVPNVSWLRVLPFGDDAARQLYTRLMILATIFVTYQLTASLLEELAINYYTIAIVLFVASLIFVTVLCAMVWNARRPVAEFFGAGADEDSESRSLVQGLAANWHVLVIAYVVGVWIVAMGHLLSGAGRPLYPALASLLLLFALVLADLALRELVRARFAADTDNDEHAAKADEPHDDTHDTRRDKTSYEQVVIRNLRIVLGIVFVVLLAEVWGLEIDTLATHMVGGELAAALVDITLAVVLAYAVWSVAKTALQQHIAPEEDEDEAGSGEIGGAGRSRLETLFPLFAKFILITLIVMVALITLSELGVEIGPLIAGAGVVGIAIGFGAQSLVRDVVSGLFFLLDDAFRMGEYVEIDAIRGTVQKISTRSLQLRHHNGPVHTIPFGTINHITNYSRDWAIMKFELRLPYETDLEKVRKIIKKTGLKMMEDEQLAPLILSPLKSQGVNRMDDSALIVRCKFTAIPGQQFFVRREAYTRIQKAFEEQGIQFAPRRVIVESTSGGTLTEAEAQAAAGGALDKQEEKRA